MIVEHPVEVAFWPGSDAIRWWTVRNNRGSKEVLRVDTDLEVGEDTVRMVVYMSFPVGQMTHPPLAAAKLKLDAADNFENLERDGTKLLICTNPDGSWTPAGLKREGCSWARPTPSYPHNRCDEYRPRGEGHEHHTLCIQVAWPDDNRTHAVETDQPESDRPGNNPQ